MITQLLLLRLFCVLQIVRNKQRPIWKYTYECTTILFLNRKSPLGLVGNTSCSNKFMPDKPYQIKQTGTAITVMRRKLIS